MSLASLYAEILYGSINSSFNISDNFGVLIFLFILILYTRSTGIFFIPYLFCTIVSKVNVMDKLINLISKEADKYYQDEINTLLELCSIDCGHLVLPYCLFLH